MESSPKINNFLDFQDMVTGTSGRSRKKYFFPFSPYQVALFLFDILVYGISLYFIYFKYSADRYYSYWDIFSILILTVPAIAFFPIYRLYSYHIIFREKVHIIHLLKSFAWSLLSLSVIYFLYDWPLLLSSYDLSRGALILAAAFLIAILGRCLGDYLAHFVLAIGIAFVTVGSIGLMQGKNLPIFMNNIPLTGKAVLTSMVLTAAGRYFVVHTIYNNWLRRHFRRQMVIIGENGVASDIIRHIVKHNAPFWISGQISLDGHKTQTGNKPLKNVLGKKILGNIRELPNIIKENHIQEIIITEKSINKRTLISLLDFSVSNGLVAWFPPFLLPIIPMKLNIDEFCGLPMVRMCLQRNPGFFKMAKRATDLFLSSVIIAVSAPILGIIAAAVKLDSKGPVLYRAEVVGENGRRFKMFKFRSMRIDGDNSIHKKFVSKLIKGEIDRKNSSVLKITDDPRVTRVGKIIRRLSLDELPQLFNVLKGDMSLVGPRPCLPYEYELYKDWHRKRNSVRPGITGLWQIAGRSEVTFEEMILLDLYYIYNRNILMDLSILFETLFVVFKMEGAY